MISIIMPTFNRLPLLKRAIKSVLNQSFFDWELIVIDDCSEDGTELFLKTVEDKRVRYIKLNKNSGACVARNMGIKEAKGDYITFLDSDDEYLPQKLEKQLKVFKESNDENLGVVSCGRMDFRGGKLYQKSIPEKKENYYLSLLSKEDRIGAGTPFLMVKSSIIRDRNILFDSEMPAMQDWDFLIRICKYYNFDFAPDYLVKVNHHNADRVYNSKNAIAAIKLQYVKYKTWLTENPKAHLKFLKKAAILIAHHESVRNSILFLKNKKRDISKKQRFRMNLYITIISFFRIQIFKRFYLKYLR